MTQTSPRKTNVEAIFPLSPSQEGILFHILYAPESNLYFHHLSYRLQGDLQLPHFQTAWHQIQRRHPILRTAFSWEKRRQPLQIVQHQVPFPWQELDWSASSLDQQQVQLEAWLTADRERGFRLNKAPLFRLTLIRLAPQSYRFIWSFHHLILDGWSLGVVLKEVMALYFGLCQDQPVSLAPTRPYREYVNWLQAQDREQERQFWSEYLQGAQAPTLGIDLAPGRRWDKSPLARTEPVALYGETRFTVPLSLSQSLQQISRQHQISLNSVLQGVLGIVISRYSREETVVFGATVSGRMAPLSGIEEMVGLLINTVPVRMTVASQAQLIPWLQQLHRQQLQTQPYHHTPLVEIQSGSDLPPGTALFDVLFVFENYPIDPSLQDLWQRQEGLQVRDLYPAIERTNYPLTITVFARQEIDFRLFYDCDRFEAESMERLGGHLSTLLEQIATTADLNRIRIGDLSLLTPAEQQQIQAWTQSQPAKLDPARPCLQDHFAAQARQHPQRIAVVYEDQSLTYEQLNHQANGIAHTLRSWGMGPERKVGLCLRRSLELTLGMLGILKAGAAYVPLDPDYPQDRLRFMIQDAGVDLVLTQTPLLSRLPELEIPSLCLDRDQDSIQAHSSEDLPQRGHASNLAYVIYTSGSTGVPKGVMVSHAQVIRLFTATESLFQFSASDVWTLFHSTAFDFSVWEIWGAWMYGGQGVIVPYEISRSPDAFYQLLVQAQITVLNQTPSAFQSLLQVLPMAPDLSLRWVIFGGEALDLPSLYPWFERFPEGPAQLVNMYGITETTVHVTSRLITPQDLTGSGRGSPIGTAISDLSLHVVDPQLRPVPVGIPGELLIGGAGVTRGYLGRGELTAERFLPDPFSASEVGARVYRSGDLGRYLGDGTVEYLGRIDHQVKLRGFRLELGEVEARLTQLPQIQRCIAMVREDEPGDQRLVAYVVPSPGAEVVPADLRAHLKTSLPDPFIPSQFVILETLPLTPSGKVDRRHLPQPVGSRQISAVLIPPRTPTEAILAQIWQELLEQDQVGVFDNFFDQGGHSLLATRLFARIRETFGLEIPLRVLFDGTSTIADLAQAIETFQFQQADPQILARGLAELEALSDQQVKAGLLLGRN